MLTVRDYVKENKIDGNGTMTRNRLRKRFRQYVSRKVISFKCWNITLYEGNRGVKDDILYGVLFGYTFGTLVLVLVRMLCEMGAVESYKLHHTLRGVYSTSQKTKSLLWFGSWFGCNQSLNEWSETMVWGIYLPGDSVETNRMIQLVTTTTTTTYSSFGSIVTMMDVRSN